MNPVEGILRAGCFIGKDFSICQTVGKTVKGITQERGVWEVKLETVEGSPEYYTLACPWDRTHALEVENCGTQETLACKGCGGIWLAIIEKDNRLEYYPKSLTADFIEEGEILILQSEQVNFVKDAHVDMTTEMKSQPGLVESRESARQKIKAQIDKGYQLRNLYIPSEHILKELVDSCKKWSSYNKTLLSNLFSNSSGTDRYRGFSYQRPFGSAGNPLVNPSLKEQMDRYQKRMTVSINSLEEIQNELELIPEQHSAASSEQVATTGNEVFIVHGRDQGAKETIAREVEKLGLKAVILHEQPNRGRTIIEKLEELAKSASFAIVLLTPDDFGALKDRIDDTQNPRARQNVIFELGYFIGRLGRERVCPIYKGEIESPSDIDGIVYVHMDESGAWRQDLTQEMESAGLPIIRRSKVPF